MNRKKFLQTTFLSLGFGSTWAAYRSLENGPANVQMTESAPFSLPALPYAHDALLPHIDKLTMEIHHGKHHKAYVDNLNKAVAGTPMEKMSLEELLQNMSKMPAAVRNNAGGHWNHTFFWQIMAPQAGGIPSGRLAEAIQAQFGGFDQFKEAFGKAATGRFGSGWAWLVWSEGKLQITSTPNQDNPLMDIAEKKGIPLLALDVWEHAYYLNYQNRRADYVAAFWNVVNWNKATQLFESIQK
jgi:superoxide dismutase, Fe-Mn family